MGVKVFISYAHADQELHKKLREHLSALEHSGNFIIWQDQEIPVGANWEDQINKHLNEADIILLLVSASFIASKYCWNKEVQVALERHEAGTAKVIPIILKPAFWQDTPLGRLQVLPTGAKPVTQWNDQDVAFEDVVQGIRKALFGEAPLKETINQQSAEKLSMQSPFTATGVSSALPVVSSKRGILRRTLIIGLVGLPVVSGGIAWLVSSQRDLSSFVPTPRSFHSPTPVAIPPGKLLFIYRGHSDQVLAVAWSPDGTRIASASYDNTVQIWDAANGGHPFAYRGHSKEVWSVAWSSRDDKRIASASQDNTVQVWDAVDGSHPFIYHGQYALYAVVWSPDGKRIASAGQDSTVRVRDAIDGNHLSIYHGHSSWVRGLAWSPDGTRITSASYDSTVQVWDEVDGDHPFIYHGHSKAVSTVAWSPDGTRIVSGSDDQTVQVWEAGNSS